MSLQGDLSAFLAAHDVVFFEWGSELLALASRLPKTTRIITRIHRYEMYEWVDRVNWDVVDTIVLVSEAKRIEFEGQLTGVSLKGNLLYAKKFYEKNNEKLSPDEKRELKELIKHREFLLQNLAIIHNTFLTDELTVKFFQNKIDNLKDPTTSVCLKDGSTSFSIPLQTGNVMPAFITW